MDNPSENRGSDANPAGKSVEEFPIESVLNGVPCPTKSECQALGNSVWVEVEGQGDCLRYWSSGLTKQTPSAVFYIHGDRLWLGKPTRYDDNNAAAQQEYATKAAASLGMAFVTIARPGLYGSSGAHSASRQMREMKLVAGAVRQIIKRYNIKRYGFAGQSGGGSVASYLLTKFPDTKCVAFSAACLSLGGLRRAGQIAGGYDYGAPGIYDPIAHLSEVKVDPDRRLFVIGDEKDKGALFLNLVEYYEAAKSAGHDVTLIRSEGLGNHILDATGQHAVSWCLQGVPTSEIEMRIANKEVIN
ncbi:alpha/beta hydrolase family protein [Bradyrhizobium zhanjiangense]|uniref:alpha/beta hydrolase family protein n=1 Tax=Bradyrhizobium zhanjiangense TaxID=1325107 RepID=UPI0010088BEB|nr:alpha/beta hydrolase [Bradyrhizobium zhanjiangense]